MNGMMEPEIRFKGFEGEWEEKKIEDISSLQRGFDLPTSQVVEGVIPIVYSNGILNYHIKGRCSAPGVVTGRSGTIGKFTYVEDGDYWPHNTTLWVTDFHGNCHQFIYYLLQTIGIEKMATATGVPTLNRNVVHKQENFITKNITEQQQIANYFKSLDVLIQSATKKIASLKQLKSASLISMFPQAGETKPRVRFKGFEGDWENINLSEVFVERHEICTITESLPQLSFTIAEGVIKPEDRKSNKRDFLIKDIDTKKYLVTYRDDIIYNPANVIYGAIHKNSLCNGVVSPIYKIFYTDQNADFMECIVRKPSFIQEMTIFMEGTVKKLKTLKPESFLKMSAYISPSLEEQKKIGDFFHSLNIQITLETQRLDKLKQIKSACLDKMFV